MACLALPPSLPPAPDVQGKYLLLCALGPLNCFPRPLGPRVECPNNLQGLGETWGLRRPQSFWSSTGPSPEDESHEQYLERMAKETIRWRALSASGGKDTAPSFPPGG